MAFYGSLEWNYQWKFLPTESETSYEDYIGAVDTAVNANNQFRVEKLLLSRTAPGTKLEQAQRLSSEAKIKRLRQTAAGNGTWRHYFCNETGEEVFTCTQAHWETEFTRP